MTRQEKFFMLLREGVTPRHAALQVGMSYSDVVIAMRDDEFRDAHRAAEQVRVRRVIAKWQKTV